MIRRHYLAGMVLSLFATGCAFFDEPISDAGNTIPSNLPTAVKPSGTENQTPAGTIANTPTSASVTGGNYLIVAPIESFPQDARNVAVVHLTNRSAERDLAICKALMQNFTTVEAQEVPAQPLTVTVWPVPNDNAGATCIEMITEFEPIALSADAEARISDSDKGPFILTRHLPSDKRMIYDLSFKPNSALPSAVNQWITLLGSDPVNWPQYRRAR